MKIMEETVSKDNSEFQYKDLLERYHLYKPDSRKRVVVGVHINKIRKWSMDQQWCNKLRVSEDTKICSPEAQSSNVVFKYTRGLFL